MLKDQRKIIRRLQREGYLLLGTVNALQKYFDPLSRRIVIVSRRRGSLSRGAAHSIYKQAGWLKDYGRANAILHRPNP